MEEKFIELIKDVLEIEDSEINMNDNFFTASCGM